jgi:hypothetical protein
MPSEVQNVAADAPACVFSHSLDLGADAILTAGLDALTALTALTAFGLDALALSTTLGAALSTTLGAGLGATTGLGAGATTGLGAGATTGLGAGATTGLITGLDTGATTGLDTGAGATTGLGAGLGAGGGDLRKIRNRWRPDSDVVAFSTVSTTGSTTVVAFSTIAAMVVAFVMIAGSCATGMLAAMERAHSSNMHGTIFILNGWVMYCNNKKSLSCLTIYVLHDG